MSPLERIWRIRRREHRLIRAAIGDQYTGPEKRVAEDALIGGQFFVYGV